MKEFITQYWSYISFGLLFLCELLLFFIKKRYQVVDNSIIYRLTEWILQAEGKFKNGSDKLDYVLSEAKKYLGDKFVKKDIVSMVEFLLTMPQKKEK